ncbi:MAG: EamA family transporter, partial [Ardenticatenaceae bacterium]
RGAAIIGAFLLVGGNGGVTWAEQLIPSGLAALLVALVPLWMVLLDWLQRGPRPNGRVTVGLVLGLAGMSLLIGPGDVAGGAAIHPIGAAVVIGATLSWAYGSLAARRVELPGSPLMATASEMLAGGALLALLGLIAGEGAQVHLTSVSLRSALSFGYLIIFGSIIAFSAYVWLLRVARPAQVSTYAYVNPVVAVFLGWSLAGEPLTPRTLLASAIIVTAVVLITLAQRPPATRKPHRAAIGEAACAAHSTTS